PAPEVVSYDPYNPYEQQPAVADADPYAADPYAADPYAAVPHQQQYAEWDRSQGQGAYGQQQPYQENGYATGYTGQAQYPADPYADGAHDPYGYGHRPYDTTYGGGEGPHRDGSQQQ
ncbi:hypothetical protein K6I33_003523, partial [Streptomyces sp. UNOB3_S3]